MSQETDASDLIEYVLGHGGDIYLTEEKGANGENIIFAYVEPTELMDKIRTRLHECRSALMTILSSNAAGHAELSSKRIARTWLETIQRRTERQYQRKRARR